MSHSEPVTEPLALLYQAAIDAINQALRPVLGENVIRSGPAPDKLPEATASRIVSVASATYESYREAGQLRDTAASRQQFADVIRAGYEKGSNDAQHVLGGLTAQGGEAAAQIDRTSELVLKGMIDFATLEWSQPGGPMPLPDPV